MHDQPPPAPRFPCLCKAIYSWGGETKRDLGFVEGDLIEALNAGDGQWWMGRLRRNKTVGLFPSNFVEVIEEYGGGSGGRGGGSRCGSPVGRSRSPAPWEVEESGRGRNGRGGGSRMGYQDENRARSPMPYQNGGSRAPSPNPHRRDASPNPYQRAASPNPYQRTASPNPYQRAASPNPYQRAASPNPYQRTASPNPYQRTASPNPYQRAASPNPYQRAASPNPYQRAASPNPYQRATSPNPYQRTASPNPYQRAASPAPANYHRAVSPAPSTRPDYRRAASPAPSHHRGASPAPPRHNYQRSPSPNPYGQEDAPPPPPPPHRYQARAASPLPPQHIERHLTPTPSRPASALGNTPSPLRNAMEDVMSSLQHMSNYDDRPRTPADPWSPAAFGDALYQKTPSKARAHTSLATDRERMYDDEDDEDGYEVHQQSYKPIFQDRDDDRLRYEQEQMQTFDEISRPATSDPMLRHRKSAYDLRPSTMSPARMLRSSRPLSRMETVTTNASSHQSTSTNSTGSTALTSASIMSGISAGGFSATSAGSLARRKQKAMSMAILDTNRPNYNNEPVFTRPRGKTWTDTDSINGGALGGFTTPKVKKTGFFKKIINSAKTSAASARSVAASSTSSTQNYAPKAIPDGINSIAGGRQTPNPNSGPSDWVDVRRDVHRANTFSRNERQERAEKQQMLDLTVLRPVDALDEDVDGDEGANGSVITDPKDFAASNLSLVDKASRFINSLPPFTTPESLATHHVCRPYRSDVQRVRAIFTWVSEKLAYDAPTDTAPADPRHVISSKRGTALEIATVVKGMCDAIQIPCRIVPGYLKNPHDPLSQDSHPPVTHYWNSILLDSEYRFLDCSLASPTHPARATLTASASPQADSFYFLTRPSHLCWTHVPRDPSHQHLHPPLPTPHLLALPHAAPPFFTLGLALSNYDTSLARLEDLETLQLDLAVPAHIDITAVLETPVFALDNDGDQYDTQETRQSPALAQSVWERGQKIVRIKALLPGDEGRGVLRVYAGRKGLLHTLKSNPYPLALSLPITHTGINPPYEFVTRHPTPHAQRCDLYVVQPQCRRLAAGHTFVFCVRQARSDGGVGDGEKPAKLGIQTPSGKIVRLMRKAGGPGDAGEVWETVVKCSEKGAWRGLVLADRSARWCVHAEWEVV